ncbi:MAG: sulfite oxidase-like oxidoreductase [Chloroflexota bacterium]|nr:sulfite oxidase-like oxidoreductase [Chloroflexota bacterium]MDE2685015.1 sulfite oxidase-like oxidoreductase [Chloroflexota bacterium]
MTTSNQPSQQSTAVQPEFGLKRPDQVKIAPPAGERVPPGQFVAKTFPVLTYGDTPEVDLATWRIRVWGLVSREIELDWPQFCALPWVEVNADFHCVTQWSSLDQTWEGVWVADLLEQAGISPEARHLMAHCFGDYTTNVPLDLALSEGLLAHKQNGAEIGKDHGWPLRLIIPSRYGWKSAKWVNGIELMAEDAPGFWEQRGYNNNGDPWQEERFWPELTR